MGRRAAVLAALAAACGGPPPPPPAAPPPPAPTRVPIEDTEPDDGVQVTSDKGHLDPSAVDAALAPHRSALTQCYTDRVGRRSWLGGRVTLHWDVAADGVATVRIAESDLGAWPIERCLLDIARAVELGVPIGGPAELTLPLELSTARPLAVSDDPLDGKAIGELLAKLDACARPKAARPARPSSAAGAKPRHRAKDAGKDANRCAHRAGATCSVAIPDDVTLTIYIRQGRAESVGFASPVSTFDDAWTECAEKAALAWHAPESKELAIEATAVSKLAVRYRPR